MAWTGSEVIVAGGWDVLCPPNAKCPPPDQAFSDGAAFNPATGQWRSTTPAPVGFADAGPSTVAMVGTDMFVLTDRPTPGERVLLRYAVDEDRWEQVAGLPTDAGRLVVAATVIGDRPVDPLLVVYHDSDEFEPGPDYVGRASGTTWFALPDDGLPPSFDRRIVAIGYELYLFAKPVPGPGDPGSSEVVVRRYGFGGAEWEAVSSIGRTGYQAWRVAGEIILNPHDADATGGVYIRGNDTWRDLPNDPAHPRPDDLAGVYGFNEAVFEYASGWVLDQLRQTWVEIPPVDDRASTSVGAVGRNLFIFGGDRWPTDAPGVLLGDAWFWVPPAA